MICTANSYFVLLCKPIQQPDHHFMSLEGREPSQWIEHLCCLKSSKSISCTHAGSGWIRHSDSAHCQRSFNESWLWFWVYTESVREGSPLSGLTKQQQAPHSETRPRHTRYGSSWIRKFCKLCLFSTGFISVLPSVVREIQNAGQKMLACHEPVRMDRRSSPPTTN